MTPENLHHLQSLLVSRTGFLLGADRAHLAAHRLGPVARREGYSGVDGLMEAVRAEAPAALAWSAMEAVLNPETWFRRDRKPFATFAREVLPAIARVRPQGRVRVWSAGCASGQEAYSLAMPALESEANVEVIATDLSQRSLEKAKSGIYTQFEVQRGLGINQMIRWFEECDDGWRAVEPLRKVVRFQVHNLMESPPHPGDFDIVLCRNVLLYLTPEKRRIAFDRLASALAPDGWLMLGAGETVIGQTERFGADVEARGLYRRTDGDAVVEKRAGPDRRAAAKA